MSFAEIDPLSALCEICKAPRGIACSSITRPSQTKRFPHPGRAMSAYRAAAAKLTRDLVHDGDAIVLSVNGGTDDAVYLLDNGSIIHLNGYRITITGTATVRFAP